MTPATLLFAPPRDPLPPYHRRRHNRRTQPVVASLEDWRLVQRLRRGDDAAFAALLERYHAQMVRVAALYVGSPEAAEDTAQDAWLGVVQGIMRFEGRSSLKTWLFRILVNRARTRAVREGRSVPFAALPGPDPADTDATTEPDRWLPTEQSEQTGRWTSAVPRPDAWPEAILLAAETRAVIRTAIAALTPNQQAIISLRDIEGWSADEVCKLLGIRDGYQRVLLHRARAHVRRALERYFADNRSALS